MDTNTRRKKSHVEGQVLAHRYLGDDAFPTVFPGCPSYVSNRIPARHSTHLSSETRKARDIEREKEAAQQLYERNKIETLADIECKLGAYHAYINFIHNMVTINHIMVTILWSPYFIYADHNMVGIETISIPTIIW